MVTSDAGMRGGGGGIPMLLNEEEIDLGAIKETVNEGNYSMTN